MLWRVVIAIIALVLFAALIGPVSHVVGIPFNEDVVTIFRICAGGIAVFYVLKGPPITWN